MRSVPTTERPAGLLSDPLLLDRIRAVTVSNHPGQMVRIKDVKASHRIVVVPWIEFVMDYEPAGWVEA